MLSRMTMAAGLSAAVLGLGTPASAAVVPGDTFSVGVIGFSDADGIYLVSPLTATFGSMQTFTGAGPNGQDVTVTSSETIGATMTTDFVSISVPDNFVPAGTTAGGEPINFIQFDLNTDNTDPDGLDFLQPISGATYAGSLIFFGGPLALSPQVTLSNANTTLGMSEAAQTLDGSDFSPALVRGFTFSVTYANPVAPSVPEPASWALMIAGFGAVGYGMRRAVRRSDARFDLRIRRIAAGEIA